MRAPSRSLGDSIFYFGELGMQEFETAKLMTGLLEKGGFKVERGISGFPTGFCATYGSGQPVVAIHTEYDSLSGQFPGRRRAEADIHRRGCARPLRGPQRQRRGAGRDRARDQERDGASFGLKGTLKVFGGAGRGAARQPALFRARRLVRRRRCRLPRPYRRRLRVEPRPAAVGAGLGDLHLPRRDRACRHRAVERPRRARRRRC